MPKKKRAKPQYKSPEARARQLAGLANVKVEDYVPGVEVEKVNGKGFLASVSEEMKRKVLELFCAGHSIRNVADQVDLSYRTCESIKHYYLDNDSQFRNAFFAQNVRQKLQTIISGSADRLIELTPELSAKDAALTLGITMDKYLALDKNKAPEQLHQHVHIHGVSEIGDAFKLALNTKKE